VKSNLQPRGIFKGKIADSGGAWTLGAASPPLPPLIGTSVRDPIATFARRATFLQVA
jgi:hypothetical protein